MQSLLERKVRRYVALGSELPTDRVIEGNGRGPQPEEAIYASVLLINDTARARADYIPGPGTTERVLVDRQAIYSVQWYRDPSGEACDRFITWCDSQAGLDEADRLEISIPEELTKEDINAQIDAAWEIRQNINMVVDYALERTQDTGCIESVPVQVGLILKDDSRANYSNLDISEA